MYSCIIYFGLKVLSVWVLWGLSKYLMSGYLDPLVKKFNKIRLVRCPPFSAAFHRSKSTQVGRELHGPDSWNQKRRTVYVDANSTSM